MDDNFNDYFEKDQVEETPQPHVETPQERQDRELAEATIERRHDTLRLMLMAAIILMALLLCWWVWARYFHPSVEGRERGYIMQVTSEGSLLKTIEGKMLSQRLVDDTIAYEADVRFTIRDDSLVAKVKQYEGTGQRVVLYYKHYDGTLPWRGSSNIIATDIVPDSLDVDTTRIAHHRRYIP